MQGTPMYAEVPAEVIPTIKPHLTEGKIVYMKNIKIDSAKPFFKPVRSQYMIKIFRRTEIMELKDDQPDFPKYTFFLTPFAELPKFEGSNEHFLGTLPFP
jgi:replication factor A1